MSAIKDLTFETRNSDLATFLLLQGTELLDCKMSDNNDKVVVMIFADKHGKCLDLEQVFLRSEIKRYRDIQKWLLQKIHKTIRG